MLSFELKDKSERVTLILVGTETGTLKLFKLNLKDVSKSTVQEALTSNRHEIRNIM